MKPIARVSIFTVFLCGAAYAAPIAPLDLQRHDLTIRVQGFGGGSVDTGGFSRDDFTAENIQSAIEQGREALENFDGDLPFDISSLVDSVRDNGDFCERVGAELRIDCLADRYAETARSLSNRGSERELKKAFRTAAKKLRRVVNKNVDRSAARVIPKSKTTKSSRPLRQIKTENQRTAYAQARAIVEELETVILRSKGTAERNTKYAQIARAVASDKLLLRS